MLEALREKFAARPAFPKRAVITGGMPYGNKGLHFGHIGGYYVHADALARFLRDRIGRDNVIFVSGTDCYGSPITEDFRKKSASGETAGGIEGYVEANHLFQKSVLDQYQISLDLFAASSLPPAAENHRRMSDFFIRTLYGNGHLVKLSTSQFYDPELNVFLNGRQVTGRCPVAGCRSEKGYADECDLGHQYLPTELISPKSMLSGKTPQMREVANWYVRMDAFRDELRAWLAELATRPDIRPFAVRAIEEFLEPPVIYLKREYLEALGAAKPSGAQAEAAVRAAGKLPPRRGLRDDENSSGDKARADATAREGEPGNANGSAGSLPGAADRREQEAQAQLRAEATMPVEAPRRQLSAQALEAFPPYELQDDGKSSSVKLVFAALEERESACAALSAAGVNYRTGKTLVPFRLTGNIEWGVPAPGIGGLEGLTVWVWPESLWAPISFTQTYLESVGKPPDEWKKWWMGADSRVYQFIGQDNIYFYGPAQSAMFMGMQGKNPSASPADGQLALTDLIVSNHLLFLGKKASSSGKEKPPMAHELLDHYTPEQLRAHFLGLGLGIRSVSFQPKPLNPSARPNDADPALKEGNMLTNVLNRVARSCFYTAQKYSDGRAPSVPASQRALDLAAEAALDYEALMFKCEFHQVMSLLDVYIRNINKYWVSHMKDADDADDAAMRLQVLADSLHMLRVAAVLTRPIAPRGAEMIAEYMCLSDKFFDWEHIFQPFARFIDAPDTHRLKFLEPRVDFFKKHESQLK